MNKSSADKPEFIASDQFDALKKQEQDHIRNARRKGEDMWRGLALSGGGIRSATFNLGVLQALSRKGLLRRQDYLSTVSGGGYIGCSLTWFLSNKGHEQQLRIVSDMESEDKKRDRPTEEDEQLFGTTGKAFPYGSHIDGEGDSRLRRNVLDYLRHRGNYLAPGKGFTLLTLIGVVIRNSILSLLLWFPLLTGVLLLLIILSDLLFSQWVSNDPELFLFRIARHSSVILFALFALIGIANSCLNKFYIEKYKDDTANRLRLEFDRWGARVLESAVILAIVYAIAYIGSLDGNEIYQLTIAGLSVLWAIATGVSTIFRPESPIINRALLPFASGFLAIGLLVLAFSVAYHAYDSSPLVFFERSEGLAITKTNIGVAFAVALGVIFFTNLNIVSVSRYYRDRLKEAYLPGLKELRKPDEKKVTPEVLLKDLYPDPEADGGATAIQGDRGPDPGPYPLINTNVVLVDSKRRKQRIRGGDSFFLSPLYCGSERTGWQRTDRFNRGDLTLSTAMAASGAAVNPYASPGGQGISRNRVVSLLMSVLNLRLGIWLPNSNEKCRPSETKRWLFPYFLASMWYGLKSAFRFRGYHEDSEYLQLSDGGHFENLGLYELVRRKLDEIIVSDASADPGFSFSDLRRALRYVEMDLHAHIKFDTELDDLIPEASDSVISHIGQAEKGYMHATVRYEDGTVGHLYYIKSTTIRGLRVRTRSYKLQYPQFPDETTADQFFDEAQFAAYRDLGYKTASAMVEHYGLRYDDNVYVGTKRASSGA